MSALSLVNLGASVFELVCGEADRHINAFEHPTHVTTIGLRNKYGGFCTVL